MLAILLDRLAVWIAAGDQAVLDAFRRRDALRGSPVSWAGGEGTGAGVDEDGRLLVDRGGGAGRVRSTRARSISARVPRADLSLERGPIGTL